MFSIGGTRMSWARLVVGLTGIFAVGANVAHAGDWGQLGLDGGRARTTGEVSGGTFRPMWDHASAGGKLVSSPVVADGVVVLAGTGGAVTGLRVKDGRPMWQQTLVGGVASSPAVDRGRVFVA